MAMNAGAIRAGRAFVELYADGSKLVAGPFSPTLYEG